MSESAKDSPRQGHTIETVRRVTGLREVVAGWRSAGARVGLVPTMGALHAGHVALVRRAREDCGRVVASLFVNPIQFNKPGDLKGYPRDEASDAAKFEAEGVDLLFAPDVAEVYTEGFATKVSVPALSDCLCGVARPGHLDGVATVVAKLLNQCQPDVAYFGEKDFQQLQIIRQMTADLNIPVEIAGVPTVREADGLALSSRNQLLSPEQRAVAPAMYRLLCAAADQLAGGGPAVEPVMAAARTAIVAAGFEDLDYLELRAEADLAALERADRPARLFAAAWLGGVRLIDNVPVEPGPA
ncbi:MAG: pantoate--beta-alanine ligase [Kiloniellales bacterium]